MMSYGQDISVGFKAAPERRKTVIRYPTMTNEETCREKDGKYR